MKFMHNELSLSSVNTSPVAFPLAQLLQLLSISGEERPLFVNHIQKTPVGRKKKPEMDSAIGVLKSELSEIRLLFHHKILEKKSARVSQLYSVANLT